MRAFNQLCVQMRVGSCISKSNLRIRTVGFKQQFPGLTMHLYRVKRGHPPRMWIWGEWRCVPLGAAGLPLQPRIWSWTQFHVG
jgi:hypothetical protein